MRMRTLSGIAGTVAKRCVPFVRDRFATFFIVKIVWLERLVFPQIHRLALLMLVVVLRSTLRALALTFRRPANNRVRFRRVRAQRAAPELRSRWDSVRV
jgi:hypothetical protein